MSRRSRNTREEISGSSSKSLEEPNQQRPTRGTIVRCGLPWQSRPVHVAPCLHRRQGRFGKQDFVYVSEKDVYRCPAGEQLTYRFTAEVHGKAIRRYWTTACPKCPLQSRCTTGPERRIPRWEHEHLLETVQERLDASPEAMRLAPRDRPASLRYDEGANGRDALHDEDPAESHHRDNTLRARLQSDAGHEHRWHQTAHRSDRGIAGFVASFSGRRTAQMPHSAFRCR
jgi:hypothetical protein